ncbi:MAG TPA: Holliday junction DNA helicase RuvB C-terminal domain-containing protein, partial [Tepidisphaeraceae bacterium]|nr:Holliday junction DNA helicase RuvB C-terminal domain-containing protein [Tepidisphaeraceae bacterium]
ANRLLRRVRDFAAVEGNRRVTLEITKSALELEGIDTRGLDDLDRAFLRTLIEMYDGGPAGIEAIAASLGEEIDTLADVIEPYLLQTGLVVRTPRGRRATVAAYDHLGAQRPAASDEPDLFEK